MLCILIGTAGLRVGASEVEWVRVTRERESVEVQLDLIVF